jgi:hypothetical protein
VPQYSNDDSLLPSLLCTLSTAVLAHGTGAVAAAPHLAMASYVALALRWCLPRVASDAPWALARRSRYVRRALYHLRLTGCLPRAQVPCNRVAHTVKTNLEYLILTRYPPYRQRRLLPTLPLPPVASFSVIRAARASGSSATSKEHPCIGSDYGGSAASKSSSPLMASSRSISALRPS